MIQSSAPLSQTWSRGHAGKGVTVAVVSTGIQDSHPDLSDRVVGFKDFVHGHSQPYDDNGQGTHVAGTIVGAGPKDEPNLVAVHGSLGEALDRMVDQRDPLQSNVLSLSATENPDALEKSLRRALEAGITVVIPAPALPPQDCFLVGGGSVTNFADGLNHRKS
jgi:subtilisin family serine protease